MEYIILGLKKIVEPTKSSPIHPPLPAKAGFKMALRLNRGTCRTYWFDLRQADVFTETSRTEAQLQQCCGHGGYYHLSISCSNGGWVCVCPDESKPAEQRN